MSNVIDNRIVEMQFDNTNFEKNAKTSLSTIDKLKSALNFSGASNSLNELSKSAAHFNMDSLGSAATLVGQKFSALEVIGVGALMRIGQQAVDAGERLVKAMSTDQIMAGWDKFAKKTTSTATLLGQGFDMDEVTKQLEKLNWYTDETSYNFTDMVDSIGKFTASGKGLTESVDAMQGIANWAALSGQNAQTASRAMYQISQAMGAGVMRKEDYKSIQNAAMDTDEFRQKALDAAVALGTLKKNANGTYQSLKATGKGAEAFSKAQFAEHLTEGMWLTDEVMMRVFNDYSKGVEEVRTFAEANKLLASDVIGAKDALKKGEDALSEYLDELHLDESVRNELSELAHNLDDFGLKAFGAAQKARTFEDAIDSVKDAASTTWMNIFELFIGNAEEATEVWTDLANYLWDVFVGPIDNLYRTLKDWVGSLDEESGTVIDIFRNIASVVEHVTTPIKEAFSEIFPKKSASDFKNFISNLNKTIKSMELDVVQTRKLKNTFLGLFKIIKDLLDIGKKILTLANPLLSIVGKLADKVLTLGEAMGKTITKSKSVNVIFQKLENSIGVLSNGIDSIVKDSIKNINNFFDSLKNGEKFIKAFSSLLYAEFKNISLTVVTTIENLIKSITGIDVRFVGDLLSKIFQYGEQAVVGFIENIRSKGGIKGAINVLFNLVKDIGIAILEVFEQMTGIDLSKMKENFEKVANSIRENLINFVSHFNVLDNITEKFNRLGDALDRVKNFFYKIIQGVKNFFMPLVGLFNDIFEELGRQLRKNPIGNIFKIATLYQIFGVVKKVKDSIGSLDGVVESFTKLEDSVTKTLNAVKSSLKSYQEELKVKVLKTIGVSILMLAGALLMLTKVDGEKVKDTLLMFGSVIGGLIASFTILSGASNMLSSTNVAKLIPTLLAIAVALGIMAKTLEQVSSTYVPGDIDSFVYSVTMLIDLLAMLAISLMGLNFIVNAFKMTAKDMVKLFAIAEICKIIASATGQLASALVQLNGTDPYSILTGFGVLILMLTLLFEEIKTLKVLKTTSAKSIIATAVALAIIGVAVKELADAIHNISDIDPKHIVLPFIAIATCLDVLMSKATALSNRKIFISTAVGLIAIALAVKILSDSAMRLSEMPLEQIAQGFGLITAMLTVLAVAAQYMKKDAFEAGLGLFVVAVGLKILSNALIAMSQENMVNMANSLVLLGLALFVLVLATENLKECLAGAASLLIITTALYIMAKAIILLNGLDIGALFLDLIFLSLGLLALVGVAALAQNLILGAAALIIISVAFLAFAAAITLVAQNDPMALLKNMAITVVSLVVIIGVLVGLSAIFMAVGTQLLLGAAMFSGALVMIGLGLAALGLGLMTIAGGISMLDACTGMAAKALGEICAVIAMNSLTMFTGGTLLVYLGLAMIVAAVGAALLAVAGAAVAVAIALIGIGLIVLAGGMALVNLTLESFATNASASAEALIMLTTAMTACTPGLLVAATEMLVLKKVFDQIVVIFDDFAASTNSLGASMIIMNKGFDDFVTGVDTFTDASTKLTTAFSNMTVKVSASLSLFKNNLINYTSTTFKVVNKSFYVMGQNLIVGFVNGINSKTSLVYAALRVMAAKCIIATRSALQIHSPSRAFKEIGKYTVAGFAQGLSDTRSSDAAAEEMGKSAIDSLNAAMVSAADNLDSDTSDPIIKPIMDLTDVQNGSNYLDAMLSRDRATSISASYKSNREIQDEISTKNSSLLSGINDQLMNAMSGEDGSGMPINVNITLAGDAEGIFRVVMNENSRMIKTRGYSPLLR